MSDELPPGITLTPVASDVAKRCSLNQSPVTSIIGFLQSGLTVPFIARYRRDSIGGCSEENLREVAKSLEAVEKLNKLKVKTITSLHAIPSLPSGILDAVVAAADADDVKEIAGQFISKEKSSSSLASQAQAVTGVAEAASLLMNHQRQWIFADFGGLRMKSDCSGKTLQEWLVICLADLLSHNPDLRSSMQPHIDRSIVSAKLLESSQNPGRSSGRFDHYSNFNRQLSTVQPHQALALLRGDKENALKLSFDIDVAHVSDIIRGWFWHDYRGRWQDSGLCKLAHDVVSEACNDAAKRLVAPWMKRSALRHLRSKGDAAAKQYFASNLRSLLLQPPIKGEPILALDPGFKHGCKTAAVSSVGSVLECSVIYPLPPQSQADAARATLLRIINAHHITRVVIGNGCGGRETATFFASCLAIWRERRGGTGLLDSRGVEFTFVCEAGASVWSASADAVKELPNIDIGCRSAVSLARRMNDPMSELLKIEPSSLGVGMYQKDISASDIKALAEEVADSCVHFAGVDANTAGAHLLQRVGGIGPVTAKKIVDHREVNGPFSDRRALQKVKGLSAKAFNIAAGFLRVSGSKNFLDSTQVHPQDYEVASAIIAASATLACACNKCVMLDSKPKARLSTSDRPLWCYQRFYAAAQRMQRYSSEPLAMQQICAALATDVIDERDSLPPVVFRSSVLLLQDCEKGMQLLGVVRNIVAFGAFIDVGVDTDGLLHINEIKKSEAFLQVGDTVRLLVQDVDIPRRRLSLAMENVDVKHQMGAAVQATERSTAASGEKRTVERLGSASSSKSDPKRMKQ